MDIVFVRFSGVLILRHNNMLLHGNIGIGKEIQENENIRKDIVKELTVKYILNSACLELLENCMFLAPQGFVCVRDFPQESSTFDNVILN